MEFVHRRIVGKIGLLRPKVHCITNGVAQALTAHALVALGAVPMMSSHPAEIVELARSADSLLVNLGMLEPPREEGLLKLAARLGELDCSLVLDPVMVHRSAFRTGLAGRFLGYEKLVVKGNQDEIMYLARSLQNHCIVATTGAQDIVRSGGHCRTIIGGHPLAARISGNGCLAGALIAACAAVEPDLGVATEAGLFLMREAAAHAGSESAGPGTFLAKLIDAIAQIGQESAAYG